MRPKKSRPHTPQGARTGERRPTYDSFGRIIDPGCPLWEICLEDAARDNRPCVPCRVCDKKI
jgi:hypothetical protein